MFAAATAAAARGQLSGHYLDLIVSCCCCDDRSGDGGEVYDNGTLVVTSGSCHRCECCYQCFVCCGSKLFFKFDFHHLFKTRPAYSCTNSYIPNLEGARNTLQERLPIMKFHISQRSPFYFRPPQKAKNQKPKPKTTDLESGRHKQNMSIQPSQHR